MAEVAFPESRTTITRRRYPPGISKKVLDIERPFSETPTRKLFGEIARGAADLARKEIELARTEAKADLKAEVAAAKGLGVAGVCAFLAVNLLLVTLVFALALVMPGWAAGLIVTAVVAVVGGIAFAVGWARRVRKPLEKTRRTLTEDVRWAKEQLT